MQKAGMNSEVIQNAHDRAFTTVASMPAPDLAKLHRAVRMVGLALHASHGLVATDDPAAQPGPTTWRVDHTEELRALREMVQMLGLGPLAISTDSDL